MEERFLYVAHQHQIIYCALTKAKTQHYSKDRTDVLNTKETRELLSGMLRGKPTATSTLKSWIWLSNLDERNIEIFGMEL